MSPEPWYVAEYEESETRIPGTEIVYPRRRELIRLQEQVETAENQLFLRGKGQI
jgi:hypothetical protein